MTVVLTLTSDLEELWSADINLHKSEFRMLVPSLVELHEQQFVVSDSEVVWVEEVNEERIG